MLMKELLNLNFLKGNEKPEMTILIRRNGKYMGQTGNFTRKFNHAKIRSLRSKLSSRDKLKFQVQKTLLTNSCSNSFIKQKVIL